MQVTGLGLTTRTPIVTGVLLTLGPIAERIMSLVRKTICSMVLLWLRQVSMLNREISLNT